MTYTITIISVSDSGFRYLDQAVETLSQSIAEGRCKTQSHTDPFRDQIRIHPHFVGEQQADAQMLTAIAEDIRGADLLLLDLMGAPASVVDLCETVLDRNADAGGADADPFNGDVVLLGTGSEFLRSCMKLGKFNMASLKKMMPSGMGNTPQSAMGMGKGSKGKDPNGRKGGGRHRIPDMEKMLDRMETLGKMIPVGPLKDMRNWLQMSKLWRFAGPDNIRNMLLLICRDYGGFKTLPKPGALIDYSRYVLFDPGELRGFDTLEDLKSAWGWDDGRKTVGVLFYNFNYPNYTAGIFSEIIEMLKERYNVVPLGVASGQDKFGKIKVLLTSSPPLKLDVMWNFLPFRFGAGPMGGDPEAGLDIFRKLDVPILHPIVLGKRKHDAWNVSVKGLSPMEVLIYIMLPELDGVVDTIPVAALEDHPSERVENLRTLALIRGRLEKLMDRTEKYLMLREKTNREKRIALILYNYPPGEGNVGGGAFLDTFASVERITAALSERGYACDPMTISHLESLFMTGGTCNSAKWHLPDSVEIRSSLGNDHKATEGLHREMIDAVSNEWGPPPGDIMTTGMASNTRLQGKTETNYGEKEFLIPGVVNQNLFVGLQPSRGVHEDPSKQYHDKELPPHHQYLAFYRWLENDFQADAVIHVGTHGTLEFLPGKESGMSDTCFPDYLIGAMPHFYFYYSGNPAEATIAKRRTHACLIGYSGPAFKRSGLYGEAAELERLIGEYTESLLLSPQRKEALFERILELADEMNFATVETDKINDGTRDGADGKRGENRGKQNDNSPIENIGGDPPDIIDTLSAELNRMKTMLMPSGLHEIGKPFSQDDEACFLGAILGWDRGEITALSTLLRPYADERTDAAEKLADEVVEDFYFGEKILYADLQKRMAKNDKGKLDAALFFGETCLDRIRKSDEIGGLLKALDGTYMEAKLGGDLIRDPDIFPTGYNLFQFDPRLVPSETAMVRGMEIADSTLSHYRATHNGAWPESTSVVLWGLETSRTRGETVCQVMAYLGVKTVSFRGAIEKKFEVIPLEVLGRPRIDCVITICGFFRDMYPTLIDFLDEAVSAVAELDEPDSMNYVRKHSLKRFQAFGRAIGFVNSGGSTAPIGSGDSGDPVASNVGNKTGDGRDEIEAWELSKARIFGPSEGQYGTGITTVITSGNWKEEAELASAYLDAQKHVYTRNRRGEARESLFRANLKEVDLVSQVRSSVDYTFADLDHYYEFFGGLSRSIQEVKGTKPAMLVTDSASRKIVTDDAAKAVEMGVRTRLLNPIYIEEMLKHKVHGVQQIGKRVENLVGLAATTGRVESWIFSRVNDTYLRDPEMLAKLKENNPFATADMIMRMLEAWQRGYWDASEDEVRELKEIYMGLEGDIEESGDNAL